MSDLKQHIERFASAKEKAIYNAVLELVATGVLEIEETPIRSELSSEYILHLSQAFRISIPKLSTRDTALRCMQQILKANGTITYEEFKINLEGCGLSEEEIGDVR